MIPYHDLPPLLQIAFLTLQFMTICLGVCLIPDAWKQQEKLPKLILPIGSLLSCAMTVIYCANVSAIKKGMQPPAISHWLSAQPVLIPAAILAAILIYDICWIVKTFRYHKHNISPRSIKESLEQISSGLCFYTESGRVILSNRRINELCYAVAGTYLQNAAQFWQLLQSGTPAQGVIRLTGSAKPTFRLPDQSVWTFSCEKLSDLYQLTASDTTQIHILNSKLEAENAQLENYGRRLRQYGENADELTRSTERLEIKVRIHRQLGQTLLATRRYLQESSADSRTAVEMWTNSIKLLRRGAEPEAANPLHLLWKAAAATGIGLHIKGQIPFQENAQKLFLQAAAESLTNAITHAKAKNLYVKFGEDLWEYSVTIYNDGKIPEGPITEGGGLSSLRQRVERSGGTMKVAVVPQFILTVTIGRGGVRHD